MASAGGVRVSVVKVENHVHIVKVNLDVDEEVDCQFLFYHLPTRNGKISSILDPSVNIISRSQCHHPSVTELRKMAPKTPDNEWLQQKLEILTEYGDELYQIDPDAVNEIGPWAALKLFQLIVTVDLYTRIIESVPSIDRKLYFDVLAGSGTVVLEDADVNIIGSPLIAAAIPEHSFDELYFFEGKKGRADALSARLDFVADETSLDIDRDSCHVIQGDANENVPKVINQIAEESGFAGTNQLSFVDNERMQVKWDTMVSLSKIWGDYLINFQHKGISRELGYLNSDDTEEKRVKSAHKKLREFIGGEQYKDCSDADEFKKLYKDQLGEIGEEYDQPGNNRPIQEEIEIRGLGGKYSYDLIYATRETNNQSPYADFMENMRSRIEPMTGEDVSRVIDIMNGKATGLDEFIPTEEDIEETRNNKQRDEDQSSLSDF